MARYREHGADDLDERIGRTRLPLPRPASFAGGAAMVPFARTAPSMLALQRAAGNSAVTLVLRRLGSGPPSRGFEPIQRDAAKDALREEQQRKQLEEQETAAEKANRRRQEAIERATGVYVDSGPVSPGLTGSKLPLGARFTLGKRPGRGSVEVPSGYLKIDPRLMVAGILDQVSLGPGIKLMNPIVTIDPQSGMLTGSAVVSLAEDHPLFQKYPTNIQVHFRSTSVHFRLTSVSKGNVHGSYGPFGADLTLTFSYDTDALRQVLKAAAAGDLGAVAGGVSGVSKTGSFKLSGSAGIGTRAQVPLNYVRGAGMVGPSGVRGWGAGGGVIGLPAGTFHPELAVPALGGAAGAGSAERSGAASGVFGFAGITGKPNPQALSSLDFGGMLEPFAYAEISAARRTAGGHEIGIRLSAQYQLGGAPAGPGMLEHTRTSIDEERQRVRYAKAEENRSALIDPAVRSQEAGMRMSSESRLGDFSAMLTVSSTFEAFGSK